MTIYTGRGHPTYSTSHFWALFMTKLPDGRIVSVSYGDGIGSSYNSTDRASEDFIMWNGILFKGDVTEMQYLKDDYNTPKKIMTIKDSDTYKRKFKQRICELSFEPVGQIEEGFNAGIVAMKQYYVYGYFSGHCILERGKIDINRAFGHVEHDFSRWY